MSAKAVGVKTATSSKSRNKNDLEKLPGRLHEEADDAHTVLAGTIKAVALWRFTSAHNIVSKYVVSK